MSTWQLPGLIDVHTHLREPGGEHKEDLTTGTAAALAGGVTMVLDMPNTSPPIIDAESLALKHKLATEKALCDVGFYLGATQDNAASATQLAGNAVGLKIFLDQTYGPLRMASLPALLAHMRAWPDRLPIAVHAEGLSSAMAIGLAHSFGKRLHICHVSQATEIALIKAAKTTGVRVTCEVTPHHLFLTSDDTQRLGSHGAMKPPLASRADVDALWANLDVVDCIATDHAPHTLGEKGQAEPPPGVPGVETSLPLLLTAVAQGRLSRKRLIELTYDAPQRIFGLPQQPDTWVEVDPDARHTLDSANLHSKCGWTPFEGAQVQGMIRRVVLRGQTVVRDGQILVSPGTGRPVTIPW